MDIREHDRKRITDMLRAMIPSAVVTILVRKGYRRAWVIEAVEQIIREQKVNGA